MDQQQDEYWESSRALLLLAQTRILFPGWPQRRTLVRFPHDIGYLDANRHETAVDWIAIDLNNLAHFADAFPRDRKMLAKSLQWIEDNSSHYPVQAIQDGVVVMSRGGSRRDADQSKLMRLIQELKSKTMPPDQRQVAN